VDDRRTSIEGDRDPGSTVHTQRDELEVPRTVTLVGTRIVVVRPTVEFDHEPITHEQVHRPTLGTWAWLRTRTLWLRRFNRTSVSRPDPQPGSTRSIIRSCESGSPASAVRNRSGESNFRLSNESKATMA